MPPAVIRRLLFVAYLIEAGLLLLVGPWSALWERNLFVQWSVDWASDAMNSGFVRGAVSGVGLLCVAAGLTELAAVVGRRREPEQQAP